MTQNEASYELDKQEWEIVSQRNSPENIIYEDDQDE